MNTQNENKTKQDLLEAKIDALTTMTRAAIVLLIITITLLLSIFLGSASFQTRTDKRTEAIVEKLDSNLSK